MTATEALERRIDELCRENERLRQDNAKLRELLAELYEEQCDECDRWKYRDRICELGIEVDG